MMTSKEMKVMTTLKVAVAMMISKEALAMTTFAEMLMEKLAMMKLKAVMVMILS